jgi:hypothetical protein
MTSTSSRDQRRDEIRNLLPVPSSTRTNPPCFFAQYRYVTIFARTHLGKRIEFSGLARVNEAVAKCATPFPLAYACF